jgi:hypothetical protein
MSRSRNIKPGFFQNDTLAECDPLARILFAGLWCEADREGRLLDRPKKIKAACLPYDDCDPDVLLNQLSARGFILRYVIESVGYIQILAFSKHQNPHKKEADSVLPPPENAQAPCKHHASTVQAQEIPEPARLIPDSLNLIPDSIDSSNEESSPADAGPSRVIAEAYHAIMCPTRESGCERVRAWTPKRLAKLRAADKLAASLCRAQGWDYGGRKAEFWAAYFEQCRKDPWLRGDVPNPKNAGWKQNIWVLVDEKRFGQIMDQALATMEEEA